MANEHIPKVLKDFPIPRCEDVCPDNCLGFRDLKESLRKQAIKWIRYLRTHNGYYTNRGDLIEFKPWERLQVELWIKNFFGIKEKEIGREIRREAHD